MKPIRKVLVANRGEIALRVMRTCRETGIRTVAVYSAADRHAPHVRYADEACLLGDAPARESYLDQGKILAAARKTSADAIHPGYGFLSENPDFADQVAKEGLTFIGPSARSMRMLGDKTSARELARNLGIPVVPGSGGAVGSVDEIRDLGAKLGYPILLKAAGGGGGKGMRVVLGPDDVEPAFRAARSEASSAFHDERVFVEKYILNPRHIEVQVLADAHGSSVHLGERECSIQRRHQKIIEESPSVAVDEGIRDRLTSSALALVRESGYVNAGTVEFMLDGDRNIYFLEVNARLQVEHPVTEMRTGIDIVREQIRIAEGGRISFSQQEVRFSGHAIECRIYAEDSFNGFLPSTGQIRWIRSPAGFGIREERGVEEGSVVSPYYDPLLCKLIVRGNDRTDAIERMKTALETFEIFGVKNNIDLCLWIVSHAKFQSGGTTVNFLADEFSGEMLSSGSEALGPICAAVAAMVESRIEPVFSGNSAPGSAWKQKNLENHR